jgi:uncharacterized protein YdaU (DUF1376 family)
MEAVMEDRGYSSPRYKLLAFFEESRDRWKAKALERQQRIRQLEKRLAEVQASRRQWKAKAQAQHASPAVHEEQKQKGA